VHILKVYRGKTQTADKAAHSGSKRSGGLKPRTSALDAAANSRFPFNMNTWYHPKTITPNNAANSGTPLHAQQLEVDI
jgi:hypothetical protein